MTAVGQTFPAGQQQVSLDPGGDAYQVLAPAGQFAGGFATVATRIVDGPDQVWTYVHLAARNSERPFDPEDYLRTAPDSIGGAVAADATYHLEVIGPGGNVVLGIGGDEVPGAPSPHFAAILDRSPVIEPVVLRHEVAADSGGDNHVMGVVPLAELGFTVVLEQPIDIALELPRSIRDQLLLWSGAGLAIALLIAWFTTGAVVRPAQQLTLAAERIGSGDLDSPIHVTARDEFGVLADRFEAMRKQIASAYEAVGDANRVLESRVAERTAQLGNVLRRVITAQEDERQRLARELHDDTAQTLGALSIALGRAAESVSSDSRAAQDHLSRANEMIGPLIEDVRRLIVDLRPLILDDLGLIPAIRWYAESRLSDIGINTTLEVDSVAQRFPPHIETALFRIAQEATNNVARHSDAHNARIEFSSHNGAVRIRVSDDGRGFDTTRSDAAEHEGHLGLAGIRERVALLGGHLAVESNPGSGTTVNVEIPLTGVTP